MSSHYYIYICILLDSASYPPRIDSTGPNPGQVPDLVSEHLHNREFEGMLDECKRSSSCAALLSKGFWWLYGIYVSP